MNRILFTDNNICLYQSPVGILKVSEEGGKITGLCLYRGEIGGSCDNRIARDSELLCRVCSQLDEYFAGTRKRFDLPIGYRGTPFQERVWSALRAIPYGETRSYEDIAISAGSLQAARAVGHASHNNPLLLLIPCHRVIHKNGDISGFAGGIEVKRYLLALEAGTVSQRLP